MNYAEYKKRLRLKEYRKKESLFEKFLPYGLDIFMNRMLEDRLTYLESSKEGSEKANQQSLPAELIVMIWMKEIIS
jgi:hypothetical protein